MSRHQINLASPDHPLLEEMVEELSDVVDYRISGPRFRRGGGGGAKRAAWRGLAQRFAARVRATSGGTVLYQLTKAALFARSHRNGRLTHVCSQLGSGGAWIGDYENVNVLGFYSPRILGTPLFRASIGRVLGSPHCRAVRVWSEMGRRSFASVFGEELVRRKVVVIQPAIRLPDLERFPSRRPNGPPRLLFIGRGFWIKGGAIFLEAIRRLSRRRTIMADFICDIPEACRREYSDLAGVVCFHQPAFTRAELYGRFYSQCDIFVMLGMADSYGSVMLEAAAFRLPAVAMRLNSGLTDILRQTGNAIQIEPPYQLFDPEGVHRMEPAQLIRQLQKGPDDSTVEALMGALDQLLENAERRRELGRRGHQAVSTGPLSAAAMRAGLLALYDSTDPGRNNAIT